MAASAMGISITQISTLLGIVLPESRCPGRTKIGDWAKTSGMLQDPHALTFLDRLHRQLEQAEPYEELRQALVWLRWMRHHNPPKGPDRRSNLPPVAKIVQAVVCQKIDPNWRQSYRRVGQVFWHVVRASSLVECMNSVIRCNRPGIAASRRTCRT